MERYGKRKRRISKEKENPWKGKRFKKDAAEIVTGKNGSTKKMTLKEELHHGKNDWEGEGLIAERSTGLL